MKRMITNSSDVQVDVAFEDLELLPELNAKMFKTSISDKSRTLCERLKSIHSVRTSVSGNLAMYHKQLLDCDTDGLLTYIVLHNDDDLGETDLIRYVNQFESVSRVRTLQGTMFVRYDNKLHCYLIGGRGDRNFYYLTALPADDIDWLSGV